MPRASFAGAVRWAFVMNWGREGVQSVITLVLAALLGPEAFGLVSMALVYLAFFHIFLSLGLGIALIQRRDLEPIHLDTAFLLNVGSTVLLVAACVAGAAPWAAFNATDALGPVIIALAPTLLFEGLAVVHQSVLQKQMDFRSLAIRSGVSVIVGGIAGVALTFGGFGLWALVAQHLVTSFTEMVLLWTLSGWRPRARFSGAAARELLTYSRSVVLSNLGLFAHRRSDALLLGYFFGPVPLALYRMAERLAQLVIELATRPVAVVALPNFARLQGDPAAFRRGVITTLKTSTILGIPALAGLAMVSDSLVAVLGVEWRHAAPVLQILCGLGVARTFTLFAGPLLQAVGRPGLLAAMTWTLAFLNISGFTVAGFWLRDLEVLDQIRGIAAVRTGIFVLLYSPVNLFMLLWFSGNSPWRLLRAVMPSLLGAASVIASVLVVQTLLAEKVLPGVALVLAQVIAGGVAGLATLHATDSEFRSQFAALLGRLRGRPIAEPIRQGPGHE